MVYMEWRDTKHFEISDKGKLIWREVYKDHEISIATCDEGHEPGIKVFQAEFGALTEPTDKAADLTECFENVDAGKEIPLSMTALRDIMDQIDSWEMRNQVQMEKDDCPLEKVMLVRCMQAMAERAMQKGEIAPEWIEGLCLYLEKWLDMSSHKTIAWRNI